MKGEEENFNDHGQFILDKWGSTLDNPRTGSCKSMLIEPQTKSLTVIEEYEGVTPISSEVKTYIEEMSGSWVTVIDISEKLKRMWSEKVFVGKKSF